MCCLRGKAAKRRYCTQLPKKIRLRHHRDHVTPFDDATVLHVTTSTLACMSLSSSCTTQQQLTRKPESWKPWLRKARVVRSGSLRRHVNSHTRTSQRYTCIVRGFAMQLLSLISMQRSQIKIPNIVAGPRKKVGNLRSHPRLPNCPLKVFLRMRAERAMDHRPGSHFAFRVCILRSRLGGLDWFILPLMPKRTELGQRASW